MKTSELLKVFDEQLKVLSGSSFTRTQKKVWVRDCGWRTEDIRVVARETTFIVTVSVLIPPEPNSVFDFINLGFTNPPLLSGNMNGAYYVRDKAVISKMKHDLELTMDWFKQFDTPQKALEYMKNDVNRNPESPAGKYCQEYLHSLINEPQSGTVT